MIWDFHGPHAQGTAEHHAIHLKQFADKESIDIRSHGSERLSDAHHIAFLVVQRKDMIPVRDALRPNRATTSE